MWLVFLPLLWNKINLCHTLEGVEIGVTISWKIIKGSEGGLRKPYTSRLSQGTFAILSCTSLWASLPQPRTELCCSIRDEWDELPGFRAPLDPPRVANTREKLAKYFPVSSAFFPVLPVWEALISVTTLKINRKCVSLCLCATLPTFSQHTLKGRFYLRNLFL